MRNLCVVGEVSVGVPSGPVAALALDPAAGLTYLLHRTGHLHAVHTATNKPAFSLALPAPGPYVSVAHVPEVEGVCCASAAGKLVTVSSATQETTTVGDIDAGIVAAGWSPDGEIVAIVTGSGSVLALTAQWQVLAEAPLEDVDPTGPAAVAWRGDGQHVAVAHMRASTGAPAVTVLGQDMQLHARGRHEDGSPVAGLGGAVAWCPDGTLIAMPHALRDDLRVVFFETNGLRHLEFTVGGVSPAEAQVAALAWNTESDVLAVLVVGGDGDAWSALQLWHRSNYKWYKKWERRGGPTSSRCTFLWDPEVPHRLHTATDDGVLSRVDLTWDTAVSRGDLANVAVVDDRRLLLTPLRYAMVPPPMSLASVNLPAPIVAVGYSPCLPGTPFTGDAHAVALLADGSLSILSTAVTKPGSAPPATAPPPPSCFRLGDYTAAWVRSVCWVDARPMGDVWEVQLLGTYVEPGAHAHGCTLLAIVVTWDASSGSTAVARVTPLTMEAAVIAVTPYAHTTPASTGCVVQLTGGILTNVTFEDDGGVGQAPMAASFPEPCTHMAVLPPGDDGGPPVVVGLSTTSSRLFVNGVLLAAPVGSFLVHPWLSFVLYTALGAPPHLCFASLPSIHARLRGAPAGDALAAHDARLARALERGARLVAVVPWSVDVVYQVPRGNIEVIAPRGLTLATARELMDAREYGKTVELLRKHRVDLNLLWDHDPEAFLAWLPVAVQQITAHDRWDLFLSALTPVDCTEATYPPPPSYTRPPCVPPPDVTPLPDAHLPGDKVNRACAAVRAALAPLPPSALVLTVLTSYARQRPPALEDALRLVQGLGGGDGGVTAARAMKHLLLLAPVDHLYNIALGMYDFELVHLVAQRSQKDPKEYLPFLRHLQGLEAARQRFEIDLHLKRYPSAVRNLAVLLGDSPDMDAPDTQQFLELVSTHGLHSVVLPLCGGALRREVMLSLGASLAAAGNHRSAALTYSCVEPPAWEEAVASAAAGNLWELAMSCAGKAGQTPVQQSRIAGNMAASLRGEPSPASKRAAATLLTRYCDDVDEAVVVLCEGHLWQEAVRLALERSRGDLVEAVIQPALGTAADQHIDVIEENREQYATLAASLRKCRVTRAAMSVDDLLNADGVQHASGAAPPAGGAGCEDFNFDDRSSVWTDASSIGGSTASNTSTSSTSTFRTAGVFSNYTKNSVDFRHNPDAVTDDMRSYARKQMGVKQKKRRSRRERRGVRVVPGSIGEDNKLVKALSNVTPTQELSDTVQAMVDTMVMLGDGALAARLQAALVSFVEFVAGLPRMPEVVPTPSVDGFSPRARPLEVALDAVTNVPWALPAFLPPTA